MIAALILAAFAFLVTCGPRISEHFASKEQS